MSLYDYDPRRLKDVKPACGRIVTPTKLGTGFSIGGSRVLTCNHVVENQTHCVCNFGDTGTGTEFHVLRRFESRDIALLEAVDPAAAAAPSIPIATEKTEAINWWGWGFPAIVRGLGIPLFGAVLDNDCTDHEGRKAILLYAANLVGEDAQLGGFSGTPVLSDTEVVGMIYRVVSGNNDGGRARFGMIYAVPIVAGDYDAGEGGLPQLDGFALSPPDPAPTQKEAEQLRLLGMLRSTSSAHKVLELLVKWKNSDTASLPANIPLIAAEKILGMGAPKMALDALKEEEDSPRVLQLRALAYSLLGNHDEAHGLLASVPLSGESGGISAGILKRRYFETKNKVWLQGAFDAYERAFESSHDPYPGINVAATSLWLGDKSTSRKMASVVADILQAKPESERTHWDWATLGEAYLLTGKVSKAISHYRHAVSMEPAQLRDIAVMRKQARLSMKLQWAPTAKLEKLLSVGGIACFTGHRVDEADRPTPRFPLDRVETVALRIKEGLDRHNIHFGFSSAAGGSDLLFIEQLLARGGEPTIFLPFPREQFLETSVGPEWRHRFEAALARIPLSNVHVLMDSKPETVLAENEAYALCNDEIQKAAIEAGKIYDECPVLIAVLNRNGRRNDISLKGGTADAVRSWKDQIRGSVILIDPIASPFKLLSRMADVLTCKW